MPNKDEYLNPEVIKTGLEIVATTLLREMNNQNKTIEEISDKSDIFANRLDAILNKHAHNFTIEELFRIAYALDSKIEFHFIPKEKIKLSNI